MNLKRKITAFAIVSSLSLSMATPFALAEETANAVLKPTYQVEANAADAAETAKLSAERPVVLRQMEYLNRGVVAIPADDGTLVSWRFLGTDSLSLKFNVYRDGTLLTKSPIKKTNYFDKGAPKSASYEVVPVVDGVENKDEKSRAMTQADQYLSIPLKQYEKGDYDINDAAVGDLDGDGEYEIVVRRNPADMQLATRVAYPLIEAYKMDGTHLWTIDIGPNEINDVDINFLVYDFDQDGKAEIVTRSFEETVDGTGVAIGDVNNDGTTNYEYSIAKFPDRQYLSAGPEFLSVYEGATGKELARTELLPARDPIQPWGNFAEGDNRNVKRASHFLFTVAYLDGVTPSIVHMRGCWNAVGAAAWNYKDGAMTHLWTLPIEATSTLTNIYNGGFHSIAVADVDFDGKDEILSGSIAIDDDGTVMYATVADGVKLGHGDAFDVAIMSKDFSGYLVWACHENKGMPINIDLHDARTGEVLFGWEKPKDTGRSRAADIDPTNPGWEVWGSTATPIQSLKGEILATNDVSDGVNAAGAPVSMNMKVYWDGDLLSELLDGIEITKWNWEKKVVDTMLKADGCATNGGTKAQVCLAADIWGDWRDEVIWRTEDNTELRIYSTNIPTDYRIPTLMHDWTYREAVAWQNNHYNQPANLSYYLGAEATEVPVPEIYTVKDGNKIMNPVYEKDPTKHAATEILITEDANPLTPLSMPVVLKIENSRAIVNNSVVAIDAENTSVTPIIDNDRTLVPLRFLSETFNANVGWDDATKTVTLSKDSDVITMVIDAPAYNVNGVDKELDAPAQIINDRTMVPIRAILEVFGKQLFWNDGIIAIDDTMPAPNADELAIWLGQL